MSDNADLRTTRVDLSGLMTVLGDHLYSTPTVAVRELVQNAHDSCTRRRLEDPQPMPGQIVVRVDPTRQTLSVEDGGAGLTHDEIVEYLATVGTGYTRALRKNTQSDELIGLFGLGFLSAFVVSRRVTVRTTSYQQPDRGWMYQSTTGERYSLTEIDPRPVGTVVELHLKERFESLTDLDALRAVLERYCVLLKVPILLGNDPVPVNAEPPPWRDPDDGHPVKSRRRRMDFARRFERRFEPIVTIPVAATEASDVRGMLWVQDSMTYGTSDNRNLSVFVRGMLLDDDARELLPQWAGFLGGVIESDRLTPTASREDLQRDDHYAAAAKLIHDAIVDGLARIAKHERESWRRVLLRHNEMLLGASLCDPRLFNLLADELTVPTSEGDLHARELVQRGHGKAHVTLGRRGGFEEMLFRALKVPIAAGTRYAVAPFVQEYCARRGGAVVELGTEEGDVQVFHSVPVDPDELAWLKEQLAGEGQSLVASRFAPTDLPLVLVPDREAELKKRIESDEADKRIATAALSLARLFTATVDDAVSARLYVNLDAPAIQGLLAARRSGRPVRQAVTMLKSLVALTSGSGSQVAGVDLAQTLRAYSGLVCELLEEVRS